jgi:hypothetical protein
MTTKLAVWIAVVMIAITGKLKQPIVIDIVTARKILCLKIPSPRSSRSRLGNPSLSIDSSYGLGD